LQLAVEKNIEKVFVTGEASIQAAMKFVSIESFDEMADLQAAVLATLPDTASILVKGSRFMKMERVVEALCATCQQESVPC
jgi:UDP-N-acetylmuramoyl-tripeptide--D-alanyl-D-alanine ligase